jgi:hypothetical protein
MSYQLDGDWRVWNARLIADASILKELRRVEHAVAEVVASEKPLAQPDARPPRRTFVAAAAIKGVVAPCLTSATLCTAHVDGPAETAPSGAKLRWTPFRRASIAVVDLTVPIK